MCLITLCKCLTEATWKGKSLFWLPVPSVTVRHGREIGQQEEEVTGYVASTVRKQRTQMLLFRQPSLLCLVQNSCPWKGTTHIYFPYIYTVSHRQAHSVFMWWLPCKQVENQDQFSYQVWPLTTGKLSIQGDEPSQRVAHSQWLNGMKRQQLASFLITVFLHHLP